MTFLGRPAAHWLFGLRTWLAMVLALYVAFWLQLDSAAAAATSVAILALPTRGQASDKALWRFAGTVLGVAAAIVIVGLFNETRTLFLIAVAAWLALCVFAAGIVDGNRAYAAALAGYTVAIVAVANIDRPQRVFLAGIESAAAIAIGIVAIGLVNDVLGAPSVLPTLLSRAEAAHAEVRAFALVALQRGTADMVEFVRLLGRITALRADALLLPTESLAGGVRAAAARRAIAELVREARAARIAGASIAHTGDCGPEWRGRVAVAFHDRAASDALIARLALIIATEDASPSRLIVVRNVEAIIEHDRAVANAIRDMASGTGPVHAPTLPIYHSRQAAIRNAIRTFVSLLAVASLLVVGGWPASAPTLVNLCILAGLSITNASPAGFAIGAAIAMPLAVAAVGVTEFLVLDGADAYPLLAMALMPTLLIGCLLVASGKPKLFGVGFLLNVYTAALLAPANPQRYDPQNYLNSSLLDLLAADLLVISVSVVLPTGDALRRGWMLASAQNELLSAVAIHHRDQHTREDASYRSADRLGQLLALSYRDQAERDTVLTHALHLAEVTFSAHGVCDALAELDMIAAREARAALAAFDFARLAAAGERLCQDEIGRYAAADVARTAALIERYGADVALARAGTLP